MNSGKMLYCPEHVSQLYALPQLMVRVTRVGKYLESRFAHRYWDEVGVGVSFCGLAEVRHSIANHVPYMPYLGFDGSLVHGSLSSYDGYEREKLSFYINATARDLTLPTRAYIDGYVSLMSRYFMLKMGDYLTFPLWHAYVPVGEGDNLYIARGEDVGVTVGVR